MTAVQLLLVLWVAEAGWSSPRSHAATAYVLQRFASEHGVSLEDAADAIVWPFSNAQADRPWLRYLTPACDPPDYWRGSWERVRPLCIATVQRAETFLRGELSDPTRGQADGWRSRGKALRRALKRGLIRVRCYGGCSLAFVRNK